MYPSSEVDSLSLRRSLLCSRIRVRRVQCMIAADRVAQPLRWVDRAWAQWKSISPLVKLAAVPMGFALKRTVFRRAGLFGKFLRWTPMVMGAFRLFQTMKQREQERDED
jgi:hypothetical protein